MMTATKLHFDRYGEPPDALVDNVRLTVGEVQAHVPATLVPVIGVKAFAWYESNVLRQCRRQQSLRIATLGHAHPEEQATLGMSPCHFGREIFVQRIEHRIATLAINIADQFHVLIEESVASDFEGNVLAERRGVQV